MSSPTLGRARAATRPSAVAAYLPALDLVRFAALAGVVLTHVIAWAGRASPEAEAWGRSIELLARSGVPCFLLLNGMLLGMAGARRETPVAYLRRRWLRIGAPWLAWSGLWLVALLWIGDGLRGLDAPNAGDVLLALSFGPGYLYFLLLVAQFSVLAAFWPGGYRARVALAVGLGLLQVALGQARLVAPPESMGAIGEALDLRAYELAPYWAGTFALGVVIGGRLPARPSRWLATATTAGLCFSGLALLLAPEYGWWSNSRLDGARSLLHPLYLPFAACEVLLLYWAATAIAARGARLAEAAPVLGEASFGVYLVQQYPLELLGPLFRDEGAGLSVAAPLPLALPAVLALYGVTLTLSVAVALLLRRFALGRLLTGGSTRRPLSASAP